MIAFAAAAIALSGCHRAAEPGAAPSGSAAASLGPAAKPGVTLAGARLVLPAVPGRPGVLYFTLANASPAPARLVAAHLDGAAKVELHETMARMSGMSTMRPLASVDVPANGRVTFAPGGRHAMVFGLAPSLRPGTRPELTLGFAGGDKLSAPVTVAAAGTGAP